MPSTANNSGITRVYSSEEDEKYPPWLYMCIYDVIAASFSWAAVVSFYYEAKITRPTPGKKPRAYFLFWGFHLFALGQFIYTFHWNVTNNNNDITSYYVIIGSILVGPIVGSVCPLSWRFDIETPCSKWIPHKVVLFFSTIVLYAFALFIAVYAMPMIIFIFYLNPIGTLLCFTMILNTILYITALLELLVYQCKRLRYSIVKGKSKGRNSTSEERANNHCQYSSSEYSVKGKSGCEFGTYCLGTSLGLVASIFFIFELEKHIDYKENETQLLIALAPSAAFLFGYWYKLRNMHPEEISAAFRRFQQEPEATQKPGESPKRSPPKISHPPPLGRADARQPRSPDPPTQHGEGSQEPEPPKQSNEQMINLCSKSIEWGNFHN